MSFDASTLFALLPAIHRQRDQELARAAGCARGPLAELLALFAEQFAIVEENSEQLYDDLFIETCAEWVVPYLGDLIGCQSLHEVAARKTSPRAEVAHTIALRRRKGTVMVLEQLARDVTGLPARAVEHFQLLAATQYLNHPRPHCRPCVDVRDAAALAWLGTAFETAHRSIDVRRIESGGGRHNIPNVGLFLWRLKAQPRRGVAAVRAGARCYRASPLGHDLPLYNRPAAEEDITHLAEPDNVPLPLGRRRLAAGLARYYGTRPAAGADIDNPAPSLELTVDGEVIARDAIAVSDLSDDGPTWAHQPPAGSYAIDPVLGRVALPPEAADPADVRVTYHEGAAADLGGGEYERGDTLGNPAPGDTVIRVPDERPTIAAALADLSGRGIVEITDNGRYEETPSIAIAGGGIIEIRASNGRRPTLVLAGPCEVIGAAGSGFVLNGLLIAGGPVRVPAAADNALGSLRLVHTTLVPGLALTPAGLPQQPETPSLAVEIADCRVTAQRAILGAVRAHARAAVAATDSVLDATSRAGVAFAAPDGEGPGAALSLDGCTVIGKIHAREFGVVSASLLVADLAAGDAWPAPVRTERKQVGCVRFSFLPPASIVPRRYRCQPAAPAAARRATPQFTSLRYGTPAYCQLAAGTPDAIRRGAEDESEMGALHHLHDALRETNLRVRLREYLRVGLAAGIVYES